MPTKLVVRNARLSYAHVLEPKLTPDGEQEKYSVSLILDPEGNAETIEKIREAIEKEAVAKFGPKAKSQLGKSLHSPLRDGNDREDPAYQDKLFINASSTRKPQIVDRKLMPIVDSDDVYSGCYGNVSISLFPFEVKVNKGVGCGLNNIQVTKQGDRLDGSTSATDDFDELDDDDDID